MNTFSHDALEALAETTQRANAILHARKFRAHAWDVFRIAEDPQSPARSEAWQCLRAYLENCGRMPAHHKSPRGWESVES